MLQLGRLSTQVEATIRRNDCGRWGLVLVISTRKVERSRTSTGVNKEGFVNKQCDTGCKDVGQGSKCCVGPTEGFCPPDSDSHHATSDITSCVGGKTIWSEPPNNHGIAEADNNGEERGGDVEVGWINAGQDDHAKDESLARKSVVAGRLAYPRGTHANKFVYENIPKGRTGRGVEREGTGNALWCKVDLVEYTTGLQGKGGGLDRIVVLDVDDQACDEGTQDLGNDVSDCLQRRESLEESSHNSYRRTEVGPRHGTTDGDGEDYSHSIGNTNSEQCCINRASV